MILENFILSISAIILFISYYRDNTKFIFTPVKLFCFVSFLYLIIPGFYLTNFEIESFFWKLNPKFFTLQNICILIFILTFLLVFTGIKKIRFFKLNKNFNSNVVFVAVIFLVFSVYAKIYMLKAGAFFLEDKYNDSVNNLPRFILFLNNLHLWGFMILFVYYFRITQGRIFKNKYHLYKLISIVYFLITIIIPLLQGRRFGVIFPILMLFGLYAFYNKVKLIKVIQYGILLLVVFTSITVLRFSQTVLISKGLSSNLVSIIKSIDSSIFKVLFQGIVSRLGNVYIVMNKIIEYKSLYNLNPTFNSFLLSFEGLIPSFIWADKPKLSIGNELGKELDLINIENVLTGINAGWIGEGYYNDNIIGVITAAMLYAVSIGFMYKISSLKFDSGKLIFLMYFIFLFSGFQMEIAMTFNSFIKGSFLQLIIVIVISSFPILKFNVKKKVDL